MVMTDAMDEVDYATVDFNEDCEEGSLDYDNHAASLRRHPLWLTEGHYVYHLSRYPDGRLGFIRDRQGEPLCSPRLLQDLCLSKMVTGSLNIGQITIEDVPSDLYPRLLTESVLQRQLKAISHLVSNWPFSLLHLQSVIPGEELLYDDYLTSVGHGAMMSLLDALTIGLLNLQPNSKLKCVNLVGFRHDRRLCEEMMRLPLLWMKRSDRQVDSLHDMLTNILVITKDKVQGYINRISRIYSNIDLMVKHGCQFGPITIVMDCKLTTDDVAVGLALQHRTPFRFLSQRVWVESLPDVQLSLFNLNKVMESRYLTHICIEDPDVCSHRSRWDSLLQGLAQFQELTSLSLPNTVHVTKLTTATAELTEAIQGLTKLRKINLASCTLRDSLDKLFNPRSPQPGLRLSYLNLRDSRLTEDDIHSLCRWPGVTDLLELNLSRNNLSTSAIMLACLLPRMERITCFAISYCSLTTEDLRQIVRHCLDCHHLKALCIQSFIPPHLNEVRAILEDCANITTLQKCSLLPESYAFPGSHISQRTDNHERTVLLSCQILDQLGRPDIELE